MINSTLKIGHTPFIEPVAETANRIRGYWGVENKVHYVRDVTQGEDASRIWMHQLPQIFGTGSVGWDKSLETIGIRGSQLFLGQIAETLTQKELQRIFPLGGTSATKS